MIIKLNVLFGISICIGCIQRSLQNCPEKLRQMDRISNKADEIQVYADRILETI